MNDANRKPALRRSLSLVTLLLGLLLALSAAAADLDSAKNDGWIGEKPDGYLGLVRDDAPADVKALVQDVNSKRKARYQEIARQQGAPLSEVEKVGGQTAIEKTRPGNYVMDASGRWRKK
jgi:uncharacterized protein YdbL (DUF1318 family)